MLNNSSYTQGFRNTAEGGGIKKTQPKQPWGIMEPLYSEEHLQNRAIYARTLSGTGTATGSNHFLWRIGPRRSNPRCIFIRRKYSFNDSVQPSWTARCRWINCLKSMQETVFLSTLLQAQQTHKKKTRTPAVIFIHTVSNRKKARKRDGLRNAKAMNDTHR